MQMEAQPTFA
jgi:hypothetical protein